MFAEKFSASPKGLTHQNENSRVALSTPNRSPSWNEEVGLMSLHFLQKNPFVQIIVISGLFLCELRVLA
jgi:hypothetical protein